MPLALLVLAAGAVLLVVGAEAFAEHAVAAGARLGVHTAALALLLAGAEPEEAVVAALAAHDGRPDLAVGDALGANLVVATLTIGLVGLVAPWPVTPRVRRYAAAAGAAAVVGCLALAGGGLGRPEGAFLLGVYVLGVGVAWRTGRSMPVIGDVADVSAHEQEAQAGGGAVVAVLAGLLAMAVGGALAVEGATRVVAATGQADSAVGLTLLALATSAEMLALVWSAYRRDLSDVGVAGALGAIGYNATATLGIAALVAPLELVDPTPLLLYGVGGAVVPLLVATGLRRRIGRVEGAVLVVGYLVATWLVLTG